jgi:hypothetical protein
LSNTRCSIRSKFKSPLSGEKEKEKKGGGGLSKSSDDDVLLLLLLLPYERVGFEGWKRGREG